MHASTHHHTGTIYHLEEHAPCFEGKVRICSNNSIRHGRSSIPFNSTNVHVYMQQLSFLTKVMVGESYFLLLLTHCKLVFQ